MSWTIVPFNPLAASRDDWSRFHAYRRIRHAERDPDDSLIDDVAKETLLQRPDPFSVSFRFAALADDPRVVQVGWLAVRVFREGTQSLERNPHWSAFDLEVIQPYRRRGIGSALLAKAAEIARARGKTFFITLVDEPDGTAFLRRIGANFANPRRESRLYLGRVDWSMVRRWAEDGPVRSPGTHLRWFRDRIDDDILGAYCKVFTEVSAQQPFGEIDFHGLVTTPESIRESERTTREAGGSGLTVTSVESDGSISGLTEVLYFSTERTMIEQGMTGVRDAYRGRGLGKWLKAAMLLRLRDEFPDVRLVWTMNASTNAAMLSINERLGFRIHREGFLVQIPFKDVQRYLETRKPPAQSVDEGVA